jgi:hypothetical protein
MRKMILRILPVLVSAQLSLLNAAQIHVSPEGNDLNGDGSINKPFASLVAARDHLRAQPGGAAGSTVLIHEGTYLLDSTLVFDERDSEVTWKNYGSDEPVILAAKPATQWEQHSGNIYKTFIGKGRMVYAIYENGTGRLRARHPNGTDLEKDAYLTATAEDADTRTITVDPATFPQNISAGNLSVSVYHQWWIFHLQAAEINRSTNALVLEPHEYSTGSQGFRLTTRYALYGPLALLDAPGEFSVDTTTGYLYYWPVQQPIEEQEIIVPTTSIAVHILGSSMQKPAQGIVLEGLTFAYSDFTYMHATANRIGMIVMENARDNAIRSCRIYNAGCNGVVMHRWSQQNAIEKCHIKDIGNICIKLQGWDLGLGPFSSAAESYVNKKHAILNNYLENGSKFVYSGKGVSVSYSGENTIRHNTLAKTGRHGISIGGQMYSRMEPSYYGEPVTEDTYKKFLHSRNNLVQWNDLRGVKGALSEASAMNLWGPGSGNVVDHNIFPKIGSSGLYLDDASDSTTVTNNVHYGSIETKGVGIILENNIITGAIRMPEIRSPTHSFVIKRNVLVNSCDRNWCGKDFYHADSDVSKKTGDPMVAQADSNVFFHTENVYGWLGKDWNSWKSHNGGGYDQHSAMGDPQFTDLDDGDVSFGAQSPLHTIGFVPIDVSKMGVTAEFPLHWVTGGPPVVHTSPHRYTAASRRPPDQQPAGTRMYTVSGRRIGLSTAGRPEQPLSAGYFVRMTRGPGGVEKAQQVFIRK